MKEMFDFIAWLTVEGHFDGAIKNWFDGCHCKLLSPAIEHTHNRQTIMDAIAFVCLEKKIRWRSRNETVLKWKEVKHTFEADTKSAWFIQSTNETQTAPYNKNKQTSVDWNRAATTTTTTKNND